jgi:hypothetical protein
MINKQAGGLPKHRAKYVSTANRIKDLTATFNPKMPKKELWRSMLTLFKCVVILFTLKNKIKQFWFVLQIFQKY